MGSAIESRARADKRSHVKRVINAINDRTIKFSERGRLKLVIPEVCKIGKILYVHLYREKWYRKVA